MSKGFDDILKERKKELSSYVPDEKLWKVIQAELDTEEAVKNHLKNLPMHMPAPGTWETIEASLEAPVASGRPHKRILRRLLWLTTTAAAAAVVLLLVIPHLVRTEQGITIESEVVPGEELSSTMTLNSEDEDPMEMIRSLCQTGAPACQTELFREKMQLYRELDEELRHLETVISRIGDSPEIIQSVIRIENLKSGTLQELILLIHS